MKVHFLLRRVNQQGGFGAVLKKGDRISGAILVQCVEKGQNPKLLENMPSLDGLPNWQQIWPQPTQNNKELSEYITQRFRFDPDMWLIELDIPDAERLVAEMGQ